MRHSQPQPHHGRLDASFLHSWMLTFSECRMAEQLLSRKSIIQKAKRHHQLTRSPQHPRAWRLLVLLSCGMIRQLGASLSVSVLVAGF